MHCKYFPKRFSPLYSLTRSLGHTHTAADWRGLCKYWYGAADNWKSDPVISGELCRHVPQSTVVWPQEEEEEAAAPNREERKKQKQLKLDEESGCIYRRWWASRDHEMKTKLISALPANGIQCQVQIPTKIQFVLWTASSFLLNFILEHFPLFQTVPNENKRPCEDISFTSMRHVLSDIWIYKYMFVHLLFVFFSNASPEFIANVWTPLFRSVIYSL